MIEKFDAKVKSLMVQLKTLLHFHQPVDQNGTHLWSDTTLGFQVVC